MKQAINNNLPISFIINLKRSKDRREIMQKQFDNLGIPYQFIEAVDGSELTQKEINKVYDGKPMQFSFKRNLIQKEIALYLSHIKIFKMMLKNNIEEALIFEDDVIIHKDIIPFFKNKKKLPNNCNLLHLDASHPNKLLFSPYRLRTHIISKYQVRLQLGYILGSYAYYIKKPAIEFIIKHAFPIRYPIDIFLFDIFHNYYLFYSFKRDVCLVKHNYSIPSILREDYNEYQYLEEPLKNDNINQEKRILHIVKNNFKNYFFYRLIKKLYNILIRLSNWPSKYKTTLQFYIIYFIRIYFSNWYSLYKNYTLPIKEHINIKFNYHDMYLKALLNIRKSIKRNDTQEKKTYYSFYKVYKKNSWGSPESHSGTGSSMQQTQEIQIPKLVDKYNITTFLDIPCGDFNWMSKVNFHNVYYVGMDIVKPLIKKNKKQYPNIIFKTGNIIKDQLPKFEIIFSRDCFVHLSFEYIFLSLNNIITSNSKYLLMTNFMEHKNNQDIIVTRGNWRPLNFLIDPFNFPQPLEVINEKCTEGNGQFKDKSLCLWEIKDLTQIVNSTYI